MQDKNLTFKALLDHPSFSWLPEMVGLMVWPARCQVTEGYHWASFLSSHAGASWKAVLQFHEPCMHRFLWSYMVGRAPLEPCGRWRSNFLSPEGIWACLPLKCKEVYISQQKELMPRGHSEADTILTCHWEINGRVFIDYKMNEKLKKGTYAWKLLPCIYHATDKENWLDLLYSVKQVEVCSLHPTKLNTDH